MLDSLIQVLGIKLRSLCSSDKHFTSRIIFLAPALFSDSNLFFRLLKLCDCRWDYGVSWLSIWFRGESWHCSRKSICEEEPWPWLGLWPWPWLWPWLPGIILLGKVRKWNGFVSATWFFKVTVLAFSYRLGWTGQRDRRNSPSLVVTVDHLWWGSGVDPRCLCAVANVAFVVVVFCWIRKKWYLSFCQHNTDLVKRESQLKNCFIQIGLWACLWGGFLTHDWCVKA